MGRSLLRLACAVPGLQVVAAASRSGAPIEGVTEPVFAAHAFDRVPDFDVAIDFSLPEAFDGVLALCRARGKALVSGTTGLGEAQREAMAAAATAIPIVWASNFSLGVAVLEDLARRAAQALPDWPIAITEIHHVHKKDAPSGTAITLAKACESVRGVAPPIESHREGEVIGDHRLVLAGPGETLELAHHAASRDIFAQGALVVASRLAGRPPGRYGVGALLLAD